MFDADRPIVSSEQDQLGRAVFAKYLARCILDHKNIESLVIGLYGGWGTGKTSLINLMLEELHIAANNMLESEKPIILNFSPWSYSGQGQLVYSFFRRLSSEMRHAPYLDNADKIIHLLELYVSFFTHQPIPKSLRPKHDVLTKIFQHQTTKDEAYAWESGRDLTQVKAELNQLLRKQKHKIVIIIDNISRIEDHEIKQMFQIIKSMGDYANTVYLLALDRDIVVRAIDKIHGGGGIQYLQKIVQLPFEIPAISKQDIEAILLGRLNKIIALGPQTSWHSEYWADLYYSALKYFFQNSRDITCYVNTLSFSFPRVKDIVNPVDFFAITALEVFAPSVFYGIRDNKDLFTDLIDNVYELDKEKLSEDKLRCEEILNRDPKISHEILKQLVMRLFPRLRSIYDPSVPFYHSESLARKNRRICSSDVFDIYFRLSIPTGGIAEAEINAILSIAHDEQGFALALLRLNHDDRIIKLLDLLDSTATNKIPDQHVSHVINALIDSADLFPEGKNTALSFNTPMRIHRILHQLFRRFDKSEKRYELLHQAISKATNSIYIIVHELLLQNQEHTLIEDEFVPVEHRDFSPDQLLSLQKLAVEKIKHWAEIGRLIEHPKLVSILYGWKAWSDEDEAKEFVKEATKEEKGLLAFLCGTLKEPIEKTMMKFEKITSKEKYLQQIQDFISVRTLEPRAVKLFEGASFETLREQEQLAILIFLDLINAKTSKLIPKTTV